MQVFIVGSPLETAKALSKRHLNNQINEAKIILAALNGAKAWKNHPAVLQYRGYEKWLGYYATCLALYARGDDTMARVYSNLADNVRPKWHSDEYYDQMKRRLFEKDEEHYKQWANLGKSLDNWYYIDGKFVKYRNGRKVEE